MDKTFKAKVIESATARFPHLTGAQVSALADKLIARETATYPGHEVWLWADTAEILEQVGYRFDNMLRETPTDFAPAPSVEQTFAAKVAALHAEFGSDPTHPENPDRPGVRRDLIRKIEAMTSDERAAFIDGLEVPVAKPEPEKQKTEAVAFSGPADPRFEEFVQTRLGVPIHQQTTRQNQTYFSAHTARLRDQAREQAAQNVRESEVKKSLSPGEARTLARSKAKLVGAR